MNLDQDFFLFLVGLSITIFLKLYIRIPEVLLGQVVPIPHLAKLGC